MPRDDVCQPTARFMFEFWILAGSDQRQRDPCLFNAAHLRPLCPCLFERPWHRGWSHQGRVPAGHEGDKSHRV